MYACMHTCTHVRMHACTHARMHACTHARMHVCMYACMHVCMYMYTCNQCMYIYTNTYICIHVHVYIFSGCDSLDGQKMLVCKRAYSCLSVRVPEISASSTCLKQIRASHAFSKYPPLYDLPLGFLLIELVQASEG